MSTAEEQSEPTFGHEDELPRVPLPTLDDTCARFLDWCAPLLDPAELERTRAAVAEFRAGPGPVLHAALAEYDATPGVASWLDTFWPYRYLGRRDRIAINANFFFLFQDSEDSAASQVDRAAGLIAAAVHHKINIDAQRLPPVRTRGVPQSMNQHRYLFSTTRIPGVPRDTVRAPYGFGWDGPSPARHIVVFHRGELLAMDVLGPDGVPHDLADLTAGLRAIRQRPAAAEPSVGPLTTMARADWAHARTRLIDLDPANGAALDTVESALFALSLETEPTADAHATCAALLHGDSADRWFDKALTFIVLPDGTAGINVEHCLLDGTTILGLVDAMFAAPAAEQSAAAGARGQGTPATTPVRFVLDDDLRTRIATAAAEFADYAAATATEVVSFDDFGSATAKQLGISPDAFVQLAYQLAYRRGTGRTGSTYESIATRQYRNGRTEAMRVITPRMLEFVEAMTDPAADADTRRAALRAAADAHVERARQCQTAQAPEQHLWELQLIRQRRGAELGLTADPGLYDSPGWRVLREDSLSTSSAPSVNVQCFGFGSTSDRCIGVAYVLLPDRFNLHLSTPTAVADQMHTFATELRRAVAELRELLAAG